MWALILCIESMTEEQSYSRKGFLAMTWSLKKNTIIFTLDCFLKCFNFGKLELNERSCYANWILLCQRRLSWEVHDLKHMIHTSLRVTESLPDFGQVGRFPSVQFYLWTREDIHPCCRVNTSDTEKTSDRYVCKLFKLLNHLNFFITKVFIRLASYEAEGGKQAAKNRICYCSEQQGNVEVPRRAEGQQLIYSDL